MGPIDKQAQPKNGENWVHEKGQAYFRDVAKTRKPSTFEPPLSERRFEELTEGLSEAFEVLKRAA